MIVGCSDGAVYVWQMETGHLDRVLHGKYLLLQTLKTHRGLFIKYFINYSSHSVIL